MAVAAAHTATPAASADSSRTAGGTTDHTPAARAATTVSHATTTGNATTTAAARPAAGGPATAGVALPTLTQSPVAAPGATGRPAHTPARRQRQPFDGRYGHGGGVTGVIPGQ